MVRNINMGNGMDQKQIVGEMLFTRVQSLEPVLAGKITGMLLEYDEPKKIIEYLDDPKTVDKKVRECLEAIQQAAKTQQYLHNDVASADGINKEKGVLGDDDLSNAANKQLENGVGIAAGDRC
jgi:hypothetical protein